MSSIHTSGGATGSVCAEKVAQIKVVEICSFYC